MKSDVDDRLDVGDVSVGLQRILRTRESNEDMSTARQDANEMEEMITS